MANQQQISENKSPFFTRNYGGYSKDQAVFYERYITKFSPMSILDPMGGQGYFLSSQVFQGKKVIIGDINPAVLFLAFLRDPSLLDKKREISLFAKSLIAELPEGKTPSSNFFSIIEDNWISQRTRDELLFFKQIINKRSDIQLDDFFQIDDILVKFILALPVLAAREIISFHTSNNKTWMKPGGLIKYTDIRAPLLSALQNWETYAEKQILHKKESDHIGELIISQMDITNNSFNNVPNSDMIITSPPYANRLDYTRMWYPELTIIDSLFKIDIEKLKKDQIGSTVVKNQPEDNSVAIPSDVYNKLEKIKDSNFGKASASYYYPFFRNYSIKLAKAVQQMKCRINPFGSLVLFIRDTIRKDILFPAADLVQDVMLSDNSFKLENRESIVIQNHIGLIRKNATKSSLHGIAQQEWWLVFKKVD